MTFFPERVMLPRDASRRVAGLHGMHNAVMGRRVKMHRVGGGHRGHRGTPALTLPLRGPATASGGQRADMEMWEHRDAGYAASHPTHSAPPHLVTWRWGSMRGNVHVVCSGT